MHKIKVGVLANTRLLQSWQREVLDELKKLPEVEINLLILPVESNSSKNWLAKISGYAVSKLFFKVFERFLFKPEARDMVECEDIFEFSKQIHVRTTLSENNRQKVIEDDLHLIKEAKLDLMLRFGFGILEGEVLNCAKHGIWSYHHGNPKVFRGGPAGFWEIYKGKPTTGAILQRLNSKLDGGQILEKGIFKTVSHSYAEQINTLYYSSAVWVKRCVQKVILGQDLNARVPETKGKIYKAPTNIHLLFFLFIVSFNRIKLHVKDLIFMEEWTIGHVSKPIHSILEEEITGIEWQPTNKNLGYLADPFELDGDLICENFDYLTEDAGLLHRNSDISFPTHVSYPYSFKENGNWYVVPETFNENKVSLFKWNNVLVHQHDLINDFAATDPTLIKYNNKWFLFCGKHENPSNTNLYLFFSDSLFGEFKPHPLNPIKTNVKNSRPAGTPFYHENNWYRPAQSCSKTYGEQVVINKINKLSEFEFEEEVVKRISAPSSWLFNKGIHTISKSEKGFYFDAKKQTINLLFILIQIKRKFNRLLEKN
jgi:hypothetical protein